VTDISVSALSCHRKCSPLAEQEDPFNSIQGNLFNLETEVTVMRAMVLAFCVGAIIATLPGCGAEKDRKPKFTGVDSGYDSKQTKDEKQ
jgi:hypothetical protein